MTRDILVRKWLFPVKNMLTTATKKYSIRTSHVNSGKGHVNVVTFVLVPILCINYHDYLSILSRYSFSPLLPRPNGGICSHDVDICTCRSHLGMLIMLSGFPTSRSRGHCIGHWVGLQGLQS